MRHAAPLLFLGLWPAASTAKGEWSLRMGRAPAAVQSGIPGMIRMPLRQGPPLMKSWQQRQGGARAASAAPSFMQLASESHKAAEARAGPVANAPLVDIYGQIRVGTPPQEFSVAIDTGSSNLLLTSGTCRSASCLAHRGYMANQSSTARPVQLGDSGAALPKGDMPDAVSLAISTGDAEGDLYLDKVCLGAAGDVCADTAFVQMTQMSQGPFDVLPFDGILGVGLPAGNLDQDRRFNFLGNIAEKGLLKRDSWAIWLASEGDEEPSEITFGDFDAKHVGSELLWVPVTREGADSAGMWQVGLADAAVAGAKLGLCGSDGCQAAFDTGTSAIGGPEAFIEGLLSALAIEEDCSNYHSLPLLGFAIGAYTLNIERQDYVKRVGNPPRCLHQFLKIDIPPPKGPIVLLGTPFLRRYFTVYDRQTLKIGIALSNHKPRRGSPETLDQQVERLMVHSSLNGMR